MLLYSLHKSIYQFLSQADELVTVPSGEVQRLDSLTELQTLH